MCRAHTHTHTLLAQTAVSGCQLGSCQQLQGRAAILNAGESRARVHARVRARVQQHPAFDFTPHELKGCFHTPTVLLARDAPGNEIQACEASSSRGAASSTVTAATLCSGSPPWHTHTHTEGRSGEGGRMSQVWFPRRI